MRCSRHAIQSEIIKSRHHILESLPLEVAFVDLACGSGLRKGYTVANGGLERVWQFHTEVGYRNLEVDEPVAVKLIVGLWRLQDAGIRRH